VLTAKPLVAAIFLTINGFVLIGAERLRRRATVRELARREGAHPDGGRRLETLEFRAAGLFKLPDLLGPNGAHGVRMAAMIAYNA
jgi:hypothetical protein